MVSLCRVCTFVSKNKKLPSAAKGREHKASAVPPDFSEKIPEHSNSACNGTARPLLLIFTTAAPKRKAHRCFVSALSRVGDLCKPAYANSRFFIAFP